MIAHGKGVEFDTVYDRVSKDHIVPETTNEEKLKNYLEKDFAWYEGVLRGVSAKVKTTDPEFSNRCLEAANECKKMYEILKEEFLKADTSYICFSHEIIV